MKLLSVLITTSVMALTLLQSSDAQAEIAGKKIIFVHGLQTSHLLQERGTLTAAQRRTDAISQAGVFAPYVDDYITYSSTERLQGTVQWEVYSQVKSLETAGTCSQGCMLVTASTGDLVTRYMLSRLNAWGIDSNRFRVLGTVDMVGAGGGSELADVAVSVLTSGNLISAAARLAMEAWLGADFSGSEPAALGILHDLRPSVARSTATSNSAVPRVKIAGGGQEVPLNLTGAFLDGTDDGVVALHSACGARYRESIDSCSNSIKIDGQLTSANGPSWGFWHNQYPILMAEDMGHTQAATTEPVGRLVAMNKGINVGGITISPAERSFSTGWWFWKKNYRVVNYNESTPFATFLVNEID
jgi:hypothetical protein